MSAFVLFLFAVCGAGRAASRTSAAGAAVFVHANDGTKCEEHAYSDDCKYENIA